MSESNSKVNSNKRNNPLNIDSSEEIRLMISPVSTDSIKKTRKRRIEEEEKRVNIIAIKHRKDIYED